MNTVKYEADKMQGIAESYGFTTIGEYYQYCVDSYINGQLKQSKKLFKQITPKYRHELIEYIRVNVANDEIHNFFVSLF